MKTKIILASKSPRRLQLMEALGMEVSVQTVAVTEDYPSDMSAADVPEYLAIKKATALVESDDRWKQEIILAADTIVILEDEILGKPMDASEAMLTLSRLSGKAHEVISGVCIIHEGAIISFSSVTKVYFKSLSQEDIHYYVSNFHPMDKAGSYAIQEWIGMIGIDKIEGDYYNVMGLPVHQIYEVLKKLNT